MDFDKLSRREKESREFKNSAIHQQHSCYNLFQALWQYHYLRSMIRLDSF